MARRPNDAVISDEDFKIQYAIAKSDEINGVKVTDTQIMKDMGIVRSTFYRKKAKMQDELVRCNSDEV